MKKIILFLVLMILFSCNNGSSLNGIYEYVPNKENNENIFLMGREMGCSIIGRFEFRNGKCYFNVMGVEQRVDYEIDDGVVYLNANKFSGNAGMGIRILDENTLDYAGCTFRKISTEKHETTDLEAINTKSNASKQKIEKTKLESQIRNDNQILKPKDIILNKEKSKIIEKIISSKNSEYTIMKREDMHDIVVKSKKDGSEIIYVPYTNSIEGYSYYSTKNLKDIKHELKKIGFKFYEEQNFGYMGESDDECFSVSLENSNGKTKVMYGYECD